MADGKVVYQVEADDSDLDRQLSETGQKIEKHTSGWKGVASGTAKAIGGAFVATAAVAGTAVAAFAGKGIALASDLSEVQNVVDTTFGGSAKTIDKFSKDAATSFGLSELQAKQFSSTIGAMTKSMGMSQDDVLKMSTSLTGLAGDMASFYNLDPTEAFEKLRSGISGETEPLKALGINMSQANLEAYALSQGINKSWNEMSQAEQASLRYGYIMKATADAQGDFAKTSDSLANQQRIAKMQFDSLAAEMGGILLPTVTKAMKSFNDMVLGNDKVKEGLKSLFEGVAKLAEDALPVLIEAFNEFLPMFISLASDIMPLLAEAFKSILPMLFDIAKAVLPVIIELFAAIVPVLLQLIETLLPPILMILQLLTPIIKLIGELLAPIFELINAILQPILNLIMQALGPLIEIISAVINKAIGPLKKEIEILSSVFSSIFSGISEYVSGQIERLKNIFFSLIDFVKNVFTGNWKGAWENVKDIFGNIWEGVKAVFKMPINFIIDGINGFLKGLNKLTIPDWVPGVGGKGFNIPLIPRLQKGEDEIMQDWTPAYLDRGERVLTREQNIKFKSMGGLAGMEQMLSGNLALSMGSNSPIVLTVSSPVYLDGQIISDSTTQHQYDDMMVRRTR